MGAHNLNLSADGKRAFMSPNGKLLQIADIETGKIVQKIQFPENVRVQALNKDSSKVYVNQNNFMGYMVADTNTGKILQTVEVTSVDWRPVWNRTPRPRVPHGCPSHGVALTPDGKEVWVADALFHKIHIFSNTDNPKEIASIDTPDDTFWIMFGLDGKLVYSSSGDIIDAATHKVVGTTKSEWGTKMYSEKELDMTFIDGHSATCRQPVRQRIWRLRHRRKTGCGAAYAGAGRDRPIRSRTSTGTDPNAGMKQASAQ